MRKLKAQLIRLGEENPELREDLTPILDQIEEEEKEGYINGDYGDQSRNRAFYPEPGHVPAPAVGAPRRLAASRRRVAANRITDRDLYETFPFLGDIFTEEEVEEFAEVLSDKPTRIEILQVMEMIADAGGYRVEELELKTTDNEILFIDLSDTYRTTLVYDGGMGEVLLTSWGQLAEEYQEAYYSQNFSGDGRIDVEEVFFSIEIAPQDAEAAIGIFEDALVERGSFRWQGLNVEYVPEYNELQCRGFLEIYSRDIDEYFARNGIYEGEDIMYGEFETLVEKMIEGFIKYALIRHAGVHEHRILHIEIDYIDFDPQPVDFLRARR